MQSRTNQSTRAKNRCCRTHSTAVLDRRVTLLDYGKEVGFISPHFRKASHLGPLGQLLCKLQEMGMSTKRNGKLVRNSQMENFKKKHTSL